MKADASRITCMIGKQAVNFLIDSGSPVTTIPLAVWVKLKKDWELGEAKLHEWTQEGSRRLRAYGANKPLKVRCSFRTKLTVRDHRKPTCTEEVFVVEGATQALLGLSAATNMKLLKVGVEVNTIAAKRKQEGERER